MAVPENVWTQEGCAGSPSVGEHTDKLDVLVNNAGTTWGADITEYPDSAWDKVLAVNLKGPFHLTVACLPMLRAAATAGTAGVGSSTSAPSTACTSPCGSRTPIPPPKPHCTS